MVHLIWGVRRSGMEEGEANARAAHTPTTDDQASSGHRVCICSHLDWATQTPFLLTSMWSRASSMSILVCAGRSSPAVASDSSNFTPRSDIGLAIGYGRRWRGVLL